MAHLLVASCCLESPEVAAGLQQLRQGISDPMDPIHRVSELDLLVGPAIGRVGAALGFGWHAREWFRQTAEAAGEPVDALVEICPCGRHHLLGAGRMGVSAWRLGAAATWVDRHAVAAGMTLLPSSDNWVASVRAGLIAAGWPRAPKAEALSKKP